MMKKICNQKISTSPKAWHKPQLSQIRTSTTAFALRSSADGKTAVS
ncbi:MULTISPECIES: hypothetical protein [Tistrella]|jgi:hypothetical protein|nr:MULTISPECIES: hypothetical protein [Tistrella]|tara:strand:+ start:234 stop:371 length:138 start_codon:yes stop_codon:yes gene_type:complete